MPIEFEFLDNGLGFGFTATGNFWGNELIAAASRAYQAEDILRKNKYGLIDYSGVERFNISASEVETIAELSVAASKIAPDRLIAVVAKDDLAFGYSRMWQFLSESINWERMVFRQKGDASEWLKKRAREKFSLTLTLA